MQPPLRVDLDSWNFCRPDLDAVNLRDELNALVGSTSVMSFHATSLPLSCA